MKFERDKQQEYYEMQLNFFSKMAHEIRTPLSLINAPLEDIENLYPDNADFHEAVEVMKNNTGRLMSMVNQLLDYRKGTQGLTLNFTEIDVSSLVKDLSGQFAPVANHKKVSIRLYLPDDPVIGIADQESLNKIVTNLLFNALKYTENLIEISLGYSEDGERFLLAVKDNGSGIPDSQKEKIFTMFYRIRSDEMIPEKGFGIGLAIVKQFVEAHKGTVTVSNNVPKGTVFTISLPSANVDYRADILSEKIEDDEKDPDILSDQGPDRENEADSGEMSAEMNYDRNENAHLERIVKTDSIKRF